MDDQRLEQQPADAEPGRAGIVRELFDLNTFFGSDRPGFRWVAARIILFALGSWLGGILWQFVTEASDRSWGERLLTNVYLWAALVATGLYALYDRRSSTRD